MENNYVCQKRLPLSLDDVRELWRFRYLLQTFINRDLKVRYRYTVLGGLWALIQPLSMMILFSLVFSRLFRVQTQDIPYPLFSYSGLIIWQMISRSVTQGGTCLSDYSALISKVYFPRLLVPLSIVVGAIVDFAFASLLLFCMILTYGISLSFSLLLWPFLVLWFTLLGTGMAFWISALDIQFRDIRAALPFLLQVWMFLTPIMYPVSILPERFHWLYYLNPLVAIIDTFRSAMIGSSLPCPIYMFVSFVMCVSIFIGGAFYFKKVEGTLVDRI